MNNRSETHGKRTADDSATFTAELSCDNCGQRSVAQLTKRLHSVEISGRTVVPANGRFSCLHCGSKDAYFHCVATTPEEAAAYLVIVAEDDDGSHALEGLLLVTDHVDMASGNALVDAEDFGLVKCLGDRQWEPTALGRAVLCHIPAGWKRTTRG